MTEDPPAPRFFADHPPSFGDPGFTFTTQEYVKAPTLIRREMMTDDDLSARRENDREFRKAVTPTAWYRYVCLGYQSTTGRAFQTIWSSRYAKPNRFHRFIWYSYLSHVERDLDVPPKLHFWGTHVSQPFLIQNDPDSLMMDTKRYTWNQLNAQSDADKSSEWTQVGPKNRKSKSPPRQSGTAPTKDIPDETLQLYEDTLDIDVNDLMTDSMHMEDAAKAATQDPGKPVFSNITSPSNDTANEPDNSSQSDAKKSAIQTTTEIATNDGTHRITMKWKVTKPNFHRLQQNKAQLLNEIHSLLGLLFQNEDGYFYKWSCEEIGQATNSSQLNATNLEDFMAPVISYIASHNLIIFAVRFGFTDNPIIWKSNPNVQSVLKLNTTAITISNSKSTSGKIVTAGYILLKHPTMTHRHRYLQFLRLLLPETTPYFDIVYLRKTPLDQTIGHLAVQCGEHHVLSLCLALSAVLTGQYTALFLPRHSLGNLSDEQAKSHFQMHENYVKSLHQLPLSPFITNLDRQRLEYQKDGRTKERTTRQWAYSLTLPDGINHAQCDAENGGKDKNTYLLVPAAFVPHIKQKLAEYKQSIRTISQREARYRDSIPGLPNVIHITSTVKSNLDLMARLSAADIWSKAPDAVKKASTPNTHKNKNNNPPPITPDAGWPSLIKRPANMETPQQLKKRDHAGFARTPTTNTPATESERGDGATTSTHSLTNTLRSAQATKLNELEAEMTECRNILRNARIEADASSARMERTEQHLVSTMSTLNDLTKSVTTLQQQFSAFTTTLELIQQSLQAVVIQQQYSVSIQSTTQQTLHQSGTRTQQQPASIPENSEPQEHPEASSYIEDSTINSPEKKKHKPQPTDIVDCPRRLFSDVMVLSEDVEMQENDQTITHQDTPSPPDAQNNIPRDPAGQEAP